MVVVLGGLCCKQWFEGELLLLSKPRVVVDGGEVIIKTPEKVEAKTRGHAQKAREGKGGRRTCGAKRVRARRRCRPSELLGQQMIRRKEEEEEWWVR